MSKLYIFGEDHSKLKEITKIDAKIAKIKPDYLLHELLYADVALTKEVIEQRLHHCKEGGLCDPRLNKDIYELGLAHDIKLVGIDLDIDGLTHLPLAEQFKRRERHMVKMIERYRLKGTVCVVVGDAHLRTERSAELGDPSPIPALFGHMAVIERSESGRYSPESKQLSWLGW